MFYNNKFVFLLLLTVSVLNCKDLEKANTPEFTHEGEFIFAAGGASFKDCKSRKIFPVSGNKAFIDLQKAYSNASHEAFQPEWVQVVAEFKDRIGMSGATEKHLIVSKFVALDENKKCD